jgi:hypothetical protein
MKSCSHPNPFETKRATHDARLLDRQQPWPDFDEAVESLSMLAASRALFVEIVVRQIAGGGDQ